MSTIKANKFSEYYFKIVDKNGYILLGILLFCLLIIGSSIKDMKLPLDISYLNINLWYSKTDHLWGSPNLDYIYPFISSIFICAAFFKDYNNNTYEIMTFYNRGKINKLVGLKWGLYTGLVLVAVVIACLIEYSSVLTGFKSILILFLRFIPPLLYMNSMAIFFSVFCKNVNVGIAIGFIYLLVDILSGGRYLKLITLHVNSFYLSSPQLFYLNRLILLFVAIILTTISLRRARRL